ncbi:hypothetical protein AS592_07850 [Sulfurovum riftiae]|uniref:Uncharacterized protein n=2 Tax=Sulfurovum riftiae TaxID=1630136 RepID=A0A151CGU8_9BACT|nr:hypothetical protein AS592_07850 [Sulfurovum riftiae]
MFKLKLVPLYILVLLMAILIFFQAWTFYLGTTNVTFERLTGSKPYSEIKEMSLRRYKEGAISPHLFKIETDDDKKIIEKLSKDCGMEKITVDKLPKEAEETDKEMVEVIEKSPYIYLSRSYDLQHPQEGRMCLVFRDKEHLYLFINGNL